MLLSSQQSLHIMLRQQAINWLVRLRSDDLGETEMVAFANWLAQSHAHSEAFAAAEALFEEVVLAASHPVCHVEDIQADAHKIPENTVVKPVIIATQRARRYSRWMASTLALAAVWLFVVMLVLPKQSHLLSNYLSDYHTEIGELREIQLADGSQLLLNTNSAVSIDFNASVRQITLHYGQARFTVAKDADRPFEVLSDDLVVRALGTVFEVYKHADEVSVTVQEHAVSARIQMGDGNEVQLASVNVQQGQQMHYQPGSRLSKPEAVELTQASAWQQHRLFINDRPLGELIEELSRYRAGRIFLSNEKLKNLRVTGVFSLDNPNEVLNSVVNALNLQETRLGPWWVLLHPK